LYKSNELREQRAQAIQNARVIIDGADGRELNEEELLQSLEGVTIFNLAGNRLEGGIDLTSLLAETGIFPSKGEARKMVTGGGVSINKEKLSDANTRIDKSYLLHEKYILVQKGRKNYYLIQVV
jgi:tyrosyl-tRNA synthetase